jgi:hypothetical protein
VHYVVYARIYRFDADSVWVGTTPGFYGTVVGPDGVVVYGTGYVYPAYIGPKIYVSYPVTYGYGSDPCWTPWTGWAFGFSAGFAMAGSWNYWCCCPPAPYWLPYWGTCYGSQYNAYGGITAWGPYGWAGTSGYIYHQKETWTGVSRAAAGSNPWTGNQWASQYGRAYNSTTGTRIAGRRGAVENVYAGNYAASARGTIYNEKTGNAAHSARFAGNQGGAIDVNSHVIAGQNGNYFRPNGEGGWSQISRPAEVASVQEWHPSNISSQERQSLNNQYYARQWGAQRQQSFQMNRPHYGGGGFHGR